MNAKNYDKRLQFHTDDVPLVLSEALKNYDWNTGLELGCGDGSLLKALENHGFLDNRLIVAVDAAESRLKVVNSLTNDPICMVGDACKIGIKEESIDFLITSQVIEHVRDDGLMAKEMARVIKSGGLAYVSTVYKKWYGWYFYRCNGKWTLDPTHVREYTDDSQLVNKLEDQGFTIIANRKELDGRPLIDACLRRLKVSRDIYSNTLLRGMRAVRMPIPGYYIWELLCKKR